jgi:MOSC domain-containing protein YiiM
MTVEQPLVESVNVGRARPASWAGRLQRTAIDKRPVRGRVAVGPFGIDGDEQANRDAHGGISRAVYVYPAEELDWWAAQLGRPLTAGNAGENLTTRGLDPTGAVIGERWRIGSAIAQASWPRVPCRVFAGFWEQTDLVRRFTERGHVGTYVAVAQRGEVGAGDAIEVLHRPNHGITIRELFRAVVDGDRDVLRRIAELDELHEVERDKLRRRLRAWPMVEALKIRR